MASSTSASRRSARNRASDPRPSGVEDIPVPAQGQDLQSALQAPSPGQPQTPDASADTLADSGTSALRDQPVSVDALASLAAAATTDSDRVTAFRTFAEFVTTRELDAATAPEAGADVVVHFVWEVKSASGSGPARATACGQVAAALGARTAYVGSTHDSTDHRMLQLHVLTHASQEDVLRAAFTALTPGLDAGAAAARKAAKDAGLPSYDTLRAERSYMLGYGRALADVIIPARVAAAGDDPARREALRFRDDEIAVTFALMFPKQRKGTVQGVDWKALVHIAADDIPQPAPAPDASDAPQEQEQEELTTV